MSSLSLGASIKVSAENATPHRLSSVTSTLPPTKPGLSLPTEIPSTVTPNSLTTTPGTPDGTEAVSSTGSCKDSAVLLTDVTVPDNTVMQPGQKFTKTWRFLNNGKCNWSGYTIAFFARRSHGNAEFRTGSRNGSRQTVDVSVELTAPSLDGGYPGFYKLKNADGETVSIGTGKRFSVKILIGKALRQWLTRSHADEQSPAESK